MFPGLMPDSITPFPCVWRNETVHYFLQDSGVLYPVPIELKVCVR